MIDSIKLKNFRNYGFEVFEFDKSINIIVGPNATGKTNLIEAILVLCQGSSYRAKDLELINYNKTEALIELEFKNQKRTVKLSKNGPRQKEFILNTNKLYTLTNTNKLPVILFEPNELSLLNGPKENRRRFLDNTISQTTTGYRKLLGEYSRAIAQRNKLLKVSSASDLIFPWNIRISQLAGQILTHRLKLVQEINSRIEGIYKNISRRATELSLNYINSIGINNYESKLLGVLENNLNQDRLIGHTTNGIHRDDFEMVLNGHPSNRVASRGESRSLVLAIKISQKYLIEQQLNKSVIFILDDVFSELDGQRRKYLLEEIKDNQTFITTTDADMIINHLKGQYKIIPISKS